MKNIINTFPSNLLCFSHLRWDFVYQRPQHVISRFANFFNVYFLEEPIFDAKKSAYLNLSKRPGNITVAVPHLPEGLTGMEVQRLMTALVDKFLRTQNLDDFAFWYYSPMPLAFSEKHTPKLTIYDCMDELSAFKHAPAQLGELERKLFKNADLVFTGGHSLYEAKKNQHANIHPFPSSIDKAHFEVARKKNCESADQAGINGPKIGFYGVIDERFDIRLIRDIADAKPHWQLILIGPVLKIDPADLPRNPNIHYLGAKSYEELPAYLSGWDVAMIPFLLNDSTRYISPTKTPEYLAAGIPVVSTAIRDVVKPYGNLGLTHIGYTSREFIRAIKKELIKNSRKRWLARVDKLLAQNSWDLTYQRMLELAINAVRAKQNMSVAS